MDKQKIVKQAETRLAWAKVNAANQDTNYARRALAVATEALAAAKEQAK